MCKDESHGKGTFLVRSSRGGVRNVHRDGSIDLGRPFSFDSCGAFLFAAKLRYFGKEDIENNDEGYSWI